jgi:hypothetical protein
MKRLVLLVALVMAMAVLAPAAFADDADTDEVEGADVEMEEKYPSAARLWKAQMIADYFAEGEASGAEIDAVESLRSGEEVGHKVGWGVVYKLMLYGFDPAEYESGWALGELRKMYLEGDDPADLHMNNLGQAKKAAKDKPGKLTKEMPAQSNRDKQKHEG